MTPTDQPEVIESGTFLTESNSNFEIPREEVETAVQSIEDIESIE